MVRKCRPYRATPSLALTRIITSNASRYASRSAALRLRISRRTYLHTSARPSVATSVAPPAPSGSETTSVKR